MTELNLYIQYQTKEGEWSDWTQTNITYDEDGSILSSNIPLDLAEGSVTILRVMTPEVVGGDKEINAENTYWLLVKSGALYEVKYNPNPYVKGADFATKMSVGEEKVLIESLVPELATDEPQIFGEASYDELNDSAHNFLEAQEDVRWLKSIMPEPDGDDNRAADSAYIDQLIGDDGGAHRDRDVFVNRLVDSYHAWVLEALHHIIDARHDDFTNNLEDFLKDVWNEFGRTVVGPTAIPEHPVTELLIKIAQKLAERNGRTPIDYLMPGIATISEGGAYPSLTEIPLEEVLRTHIVDKDEPFLWPVSYLILKDMTVGYNPYVSDSDTYAEITESEGLRLVMHSKLTRTFAQTYADFQAFNESEGTLLSRLSSLRAILKRNDAHGGIGRGDSAGQEIYPAIMDFFEYYQEFILPCDLLSSESDRTDWTLTNIIDNEDGTISSSPIPPELLAELFPNTDIPVNEMRYVYTEIEGDLKLYFLNFHNDTLEEINLEERRDEEEEKENDKKQRINELREVLGNKDDNSFPILEKLNKIREMTGHNYLLEPSHVPEETKNEIALLWDYSQNYGINTGPGVVATCIAIRGGAIERAIKNEADILSTIGISDEANTQKCSELLEAADESREALRLAFGLHEESDEHEEEKTSMIAPSSCLGYSGSDQLFITNELLERMGQRLVFEYPADINMINLLSDSDIHAIFRESEESVESVELQDALLAQIGSFEDFVMFLTNIPSARQVQAVVEVMGSKIFTKYIGNNDRRPTNFSALLAPLTPDKTKAVCDGLREYLVSDGSSETRLTIIKNVYHLNKVLRNLDDTQTVIVLESIEGRLPMLIKSGFDINEVLKSLNGEQVTAVIHFLVGEFPGMMITTDDDFRRVIKYLNEEQRDAVFYSLVDKFPGMIKSAFGFKQVLEHLNEGQRTNVFESLMNEGSFPDLIVSAWDLEKVLTYLNGEQITILLRHLTGNGSLSGLIATAGDLKLVLFRLNEEQITIVFDSLVDDLPKIIKSTHSLIYVLEALNEAQTTTVLENLVGVGMLSKLISSPEDIEQLSNCLDEDQIAFVRESIQPDEALVLQGSVSQHSSLLSSHSGVYHFYKGESRHRYEGNTAHADVEVKGQAPQKARRLGSN